MTSSEISTNTGAFPLRRTTSLLIGSALSARIMMDTLLAMSDVLSLSFAFIVAIQLRMVVIQPIAAFLHMAIPDTKYITLDLYRSALLPGLVLFILLFYLRDLYPGNRMGPVEELRRLSINTTFVYLGLISFAFIGRASFSYSRSILILSWALSLVVLPMMRSIVRSLAVHLGQWGEPVAVLGDADRIRKVVQHLLKNPRIGMRPVFVFPNEPGNLELPGNVVQLSPLYLEQVCKQYRLDCALVCSNDDRAINASESIFNRLILLKSDPVSSLIWALASSMSGIAGYEIKVNLNSFTATLAKRLIDIVGALVGLIITGPVILLSGLLVTLTSKGPMFYFQTRVGKDGKLFRFYKIRTMHQDAEALLERCLKENPELKKEWDTYQKLQNDPRIVGVGHLLRRYSIDELPQLVNVLLGDMSLVGPRPFFPKQQGIYGERLNQYMRVCPGLTGIWQVSGRSNLIFEERTRLDEYYVQNWSIWLDIIILSQTVWAVIRKDGAC